MADLEGKTIAATYRSLLNVGTANQEFTTTPRVINDGAGGASALYLATDEVLINSTYQLTFNATGSGEYIYGDGTDLRVYSGADILLMPTGKVGIGTLTPTYTLDVESGSTQIVASFISTTDTAEIAIGDDADIAYFGMSDNGGYGGVGLAWVGFNSGESVNNLNVDANGYVGIGTQDPQSPLHIASAAEGSISDGASNIPQLLVSSSGDDGTKSGPIICLHNSTDADDDDYIGTVMFSGGDSGNASPGDPAQGETYAAVSARIIDETDGSAAGAVYFNCQSGDAFSTAMTILGSTGSIYPQVGIGTATPAKALHVVNSALVKGRATFTLTGSINVDGANTDVPGTNTKYLTELSIGDDIVVSSETRTIASITNDTTATVSAAWGSDLANDTSPDCNPAAFTVIRDNGDIGIILDDSGNVGIGTAVPTTDLHVKAVSNDEGFLFESSASTTALATIYQQDTDDCLMKLYNAGTAHVLFHTGSASMSYIGATGYGGDFGIGKTDPGYRLEMGANSAAKPSSVEWTVTSDERIKEDIELADLDRCYEIVKSLPLKRFKWKDSAYDDDMINDRKMLGWIAQDVQSVFPKAVGTHRFTGVPVENGEKDENGNICEWELEIDDCLDLDGDQISKALYGAVQTLIAKVEALENNNNQGDSSNEQE